MTDHPRWRDRAWARRSVTVPAIMLIFAAAWTSAPVALPVALGVDGVRWMRTRTPWMASRLVLFLMAYSLAEVAGLAALLGSWSMSLGGRLFDLTASTFAIQQAWAGGIFAATRVIFGLTVTAHGLDAVRTTPFVLIARHASIVDNLLPARFISHPDGTHIRYVMKRELLWDPALDVAGNRLVNVFIDRAAGEGEREVATLRELASSLPADQAILIYPEGTRFTADKRARMMAVLARRNPTVHDKVCKLENVLPPRPGGTIGLLEGCSADVVVMAHRGLDGFARIADIWRGGMVRRQVTVEFWRIPRSEIPEGRSARVDWLFELWGRVDRWVGDVT